MAITFAKNINATQQQGINDLVASGRTFNETDAKNYAYATGAGDYNQFLGKTGSQITIPASVSADSMTTGSTFKTVPGVNPADPTPYVQSLADATKQAQTDYQALLKSTAQNSGVGTLESERTGLTGRLQSALEKLTGRGTALQTAEDNLGVTQDLGRLKELNLQVTNLTNEYGKRIASIPGQGIGLTTGAVAQLTDREKRMAAVEIGGLAAVQSALQGNIALSQQQAERTVNMEFEPYEQEVKNLQTQLELNYDNLSRAEKKQADELGYVLQQRQATIDQQKEDRLSIINMATEAAQQGADTVTLNKILKAGTIEDALAIAGDSLGAGFRAQQDQQKFENNLASGKISGSGGGGGDGGDWGNGFDDTTDPTPDPNAPAQVEVPATFEEYLTQQEDKSGQSFSQVKRDALKKTYETLKATPASTAHTKDLSKYSFAVRQVILGYETAGSLITGGTAKERSRYQQELNQAQKEGLLNQGPSETQKKVISSINDSVSKNETYKRAISMQGYVSNVQAALSQGTGVGDLAAINQFQKVIDEGAVTRDQDVKLIQQSQSLVNTLRTKEKKLRKGEQLSPELRRQMNTAISALYNAQLSALKKDPYIKAKQIEAKNSNINLDQTILGEIVTFGDQNSSSSSSGAASILSKYGVSQ